MRLRAVLVLGLLLSLVVVLPTGARAGDTIRHQLGLVAPQTALLRSRPSASGAVLAHLIQQTQVRVLSSSHGWSRVQVWGSLRGWLPKSAITYRKPWFVQSTYHAPAVKSTIKVQPPRSLKTSAITLGTMKLERAPGKSVTGTLPANTRVTVSAWQQDSQGTVWYRIGTSWTSGPLRFVLPMPSPNRWNVIAGKGMWLTLGTAGESDPTALIRTAKNDGITHLYVESAISPLGFHGEGVVGPIIDAAHAAGLRVIAWVYPYLSDIAADVDLTLRVAAYRTATGEHFDGIAADLERNMDATHIRTYSQLVRRYAGSRALLVGVTYPPQSDPTYPFLEVAHFYNVIAPMDYWHQTRGRYGLNYSGLPYGFTYARRYAEDSVAPIRRVAPGAAVMPIGQTFDDFGRLEMGPYAPSAAEVRGFLAGCKAAGAPGVSFFQWMTATASEWSAIRGFRFK